MLRRCLSMLVAVSLVLSFGIANAVTVTPIFNFDNMTPNANGNTLAQASSAWSVAPYNDYGADNYEGWSSTANSMSFYRYVVWDNNSHMGYPYYGFLEIDNQVSLKGNALKCTITGGNNAANLNGTGLKVSNKSEYVAQKGSSYSNAVVGDPYIYFLANRNWSPNAPPQQTFPMAPSNANRLSIYVKAPAGISVDQGAGRPQETWSIGPYSNKGPSGGASTGGHFYHDIPIGGGGWTKLQLDNHPRYHNAGVTILKNIPGYIPAITGFYVAGANYEGQVMTPYSLWIDEIQFEYDDYAQQNNETINSLSVSYNDSANTWEVGFYDKYQDHVYYTKAKATYEIRYSFSPITNENWASATPASIQAYSNFGIEARTDGRFKRVSNDDYQMVWSRFKLASAADDATFAATGHIYFAVKDVSQDPNNLHNINPGLTGTLAGQGRDYTGASSVFTDYANDAANLPYIKRIDFILPGGSTSTADVTAPVVTAFTIPATSSTLSVPVSSFSATDAVGVTGYLITETSTPPAASAAGWSASAPATYTATSTGSHTLYPWAKDAAGNVSALYGSPDTVVISTSVDTTPPTVSMSYPANNASISGTVSLSVAAADNTGVSRVEYYANGTLLYATNVAPYGYSWNTTAVANGAYALTVKAYDAAGNVGQSSAVTVTVNNTTADTIAPSVTAFSVPATAASLTVPVSTLSATDNVAVTGYLVTESATTPAAISTAWSSSTPASYTVAGTGSRTLYAWAKDGAGNVSASRSATVTVTATTSSAPTADPQANAKTQSILNYLVNLPTRATDKVISGQHTYVTDNLIPGIYGSTGEYPGLVGIDYFYQNTTAGNNLAISQSNGNGLVTILHHWNNPATGGTAWDTSNVDLVQLITSGTALNKTFNGYLDSVASGLQTLQNNNVTVLYRPFHEMNGSWFWWGGKDATQFKNVWKYVFNYMTTTKGLHNLLWVYGPNAGLNMTAYYPGSQYVDVVGMDLYGSPSVSDTADYNALVALNKPFGLTEYGPCASSGCTSSVDWTPFISSLKTAMPKTAFWMNWAGTFSMEANKGTSTVLADPWVITRDKMPAASGSDTTAPVAAITAPAANTSISSTVSVTATATDAVGVTKVEFYVNGVLMATDTAFPYSFNWDTTAVANGAYNLTAKAYDAAGNIGQSSAVTITVSNTVADTTAPSVAISSPANSSTLSGTAAITTTASDNVGVSKVEFYVNGVLTAVDTTSPYSFSWNTTSVANGACTLTAKAYDAVGNVGQSSAVTVTVNNTVADTTAPSVAISSPANGATLSGTAAITTTASDNVGVSKVEFYVNGVLTATDTTSPYSFSWNTASVANGGYTLTAKAYDAAGNVGQSSAVTVTVNNTAADSTPPAVTLSEPGNGWIMSGIISFMASATDNVGVTKLEYYADGKLLYTYAGSSYLYRWDTATVANGAHTLTVKAYDAAGNVGQSSAVTITVSNMVVDTTAPSVAISSPANGATLSGTAAISTTASDNVGVSKVEFYVNGVLAATDTASPYSFSWDTTTVANGSYTLTAKAYDAAGNVGQSSAVTVTVNNTVGDTTAPTVSISSPRNGSRVRSSVTIKATATDNVGVTKMVLYLDGIQVSSSTGSSISWTWNTRNYASGSHVIRATAYDAANNSSSSSITVTK